MRIINRILFISGMLLSATVGIAQEAGQAVKLEYGTIEAVQTVQAQGKRAAGTMLGGLAGAAIADDHRGLGMLAGGLIGGSIEKSQTSKDALQQL